MAYVMLLFCFLFLRACLLRLAPRLNGKGVLETVVLTVHVKLIHIIQAVKHVPNSNVNILYFPELLNICLKVRCLLTIYQARSRRFASRPIGVDRSIGTFFPGFLRLGRFCALSSSALRLFAARLASARFPLLKYSGYSLL